MSYVSDAQDLPRGTANITSGEFTACPFDHYRSLQQVGPIFTAPGIGYGVIGYRELVELGRDTKRFSRQLDMTETRRLFGVDAGSLPAEVDRLLVEASTHSPALFSADPPIHTRHRKLVSQAFLPRRVRAMEPMVQAHASRLMEPFAAAGGGDIISQLAVPLPLAVLGDILGVDCADLDLLKRWSDDLLRGIGGIVDPDERVSIAHSLLQFQSYFFERIQERRSQPCDDLLSDLVHAEVGGEGHLRLDELFPIIVQLVVAGHETTANFIGNAMVILLRRPELVAKLRADETAIPAFLEECLRFDPPLHATVRRAACDMHFGGVAIERDETILPFWGAANHDPTIFPDPDRFDPDRDNLRRHLTFGHGIHFCIGAELARMEGRVAFETFLRRFSHVELEEQRSDLTDRGGYSHYGYRRVVVRIGSTESGDE